MTPDVQVPMTTTTVGMTSEAGLLVTSQRSLFFPWAAGESNRCEQARSWYNKSAPKTCEVEPDPEPLPRPVPRVASAHYRHFHALARLIACVQQGHSGLVMTLTTMVHCDQNVTATLRLSRSRV